MDSFNIKCFNMYMITAYSTCTFNMEESHKKRLSMSACQLGLFKERILLFKGIQTIFSLRTYANRVQLAKPK